MSSTCLLLLWLKTVETCVIWPQIYKIWIHTLPPRMFGVDCFWLETTIIIKIESHSFYLIICAWFRWGWSKIFGLFCYEEVFFRTAWQPYGLSHIHAHHINLSYKSKDQSLKFWRKKIENWRFWKSQFLWVGHYDFFFIPIKIRHKLWGRMDGTQSLWLLWFPAKNNTPQTLLGGNV